MINFAHQDQIHRDNLKKEKWLPGTISQEFLEATNPYLIRQKYSLEKVQEDSHRLSVTELRRMISD